MFKSLDNSVLNMSSTCHSNTRHATIPVSWDVRPYTDTDGELDNATSSFTIHTLPAGLLLRSSGEVPGSPVRSCKQGAALYPQGRWMWQARLLSTAPHSRCSSSNREKWKPRCCRRLSGCQGLLVTAFILVRPAHNN